MNFVVDNQQHLVTNTAIYSVNTRSRVHLHRAIATQSCFQKSVYYSGIKTFKSITESEKYE